ncbi:hypothetical protein [Trujillonella humicola]|uniref:hypothetical protein n=1 Tax=Trujillonella humicola TaxID=3383699 RepID=UPI003906C7C3
MDRTNETAATGAAGIDPRHDGTPARDHTWDLVAAVAGLVFFVLVVASFFTPGTPMADEGGAAIAADVAADRTGHQWSLLLGFLGDVAFLLFLSGLWSRLRRAEGRAGLFSAVVAIAGAVFVATILVSEGLYLALVTGTAEIAEDPAVFTTLAVLNDWVGFAGVPAAAALFLGAAAAIVGTRALPRWIGWWAAVVSVLLLVSLGGVFQADIDEAGLGWAAFPAFVLMMLWVLTTSILLLLRARRPAAAPQEVTSG